MGTFTRDSGFLRIVSLFAYFIPYVGTYVALALNVRANDVDRRNANRAARDAYNASLLDRQQVIRSAEAPRGICYGETQISGVLTYARAYGTNNANLVMVVSLFAGHEIQAIDEIWIGDRAVGALDGSGFPTGAPFLTTTATWEAVSVASTQNANQAVSAAHAPIAGTVAAVSDNTQDNPSVNCPIVSVIGTTVTIDSSAVVGNINITITYHHNVTTAWLRIKKYLGAAVQTHDTDIAAASGGEWNTAHDGQGVAYLAMFAIYNEDVFPSGVENVRARVRGKKTFDPRSSTTTYNKNPALAARDYLTDALGFGCSAGEIDDPSFIAAANVCEEVVSEPVWNGSAWVVANDHFRYQCDTFLSTASARAENLQILADAMAGYIVYSQGKWRAYAGAFTTPTVTLTEADLANTGEIAINARAPRRSLFNTVRGTFADALNNYQVTDYPPVTNATYKTQDGGEELVADIPLPAVTDVVRAQRLAKIFLERHRQALTLQAMFNLHAYAVTPGDIIAITLARYGFSAKPFRVLEREFSLAAGVRLTLREEAAGVYTWGSAEADTEDLAPNTTLPNPFTVAAIGAVTLASGTAHLQRNADGTVVARIRASWPAIADVNVTQGGSIEVELLRVSAPTAGTFERVFELRGDAVEVLIPNVEEDRFYQVRVRARNGLRVHSIWTHSANHRVIGKTEPPSNVSGLTSELSGNGILLKWNEATDIDYQATELRLGTTWNTAVVITRKTSRTHLWGWQLAAAHTVLAKHYDTSGNESTVAASTVVNVAAPGTPSLVATVIANNVLLNWSDAQTTQPISLYRFKVGTTFAGATEIGTAGGDSRFETYFFVDTGTKKIWIQAEDVAGNLGTPASVDVLITSALGFKLRQDFTSTFAATKTNALLYGTGLELGVNTTQTWAQHFSAGAWTTSQDKVNAGYGIHVLPSTATGQYQEVFDFGTTLNAATTIAVTLAQQIITGGGTLTVNISVSNTSSTGPWTDGPTNAANWTTSGFRWVRVTIGWAGDGGTNDLVLIDNLRTRLSQQKKTETGVVACVSTDTGGTTFTFTETFAAIDSIQATPVGTVDRRAVVDFTYSTVNPTTCKVLLFDAAGARASGDVRLTIEGFN
jgi:hypothetical protein